MNLELWIAFWLCFLGSGAFIVDAVVLWHHRPKLAWVSFPMAVALLTLVSLLDISRSWLGLLSWLVAIATIGITYASLEYVAFKRKNHL